MKIECEANNTYKPSEIQKSLMIEHISNVDDLETHVEKAVLRSLMHLTPTEAQRVKHNKWLTTNQVMEILQSSRGQIQHLKNSGKLPYTKNNRTIKYDIDGIERHLSKKNKAGLYLPDLMRPNEVKAILDTLNIDLKNRKDGSNGWIFIRNPLNPSIKKNFSINKHHGAFKDHENEEIKGDLIKLVQLMTGVNRVESKIWIASRIQKGNNAINEYKKTLFKLHRQLSIHSRGN